MSILLLIPCFWQRRIQAVDLASHIYNSWLAQQIELGKASGLEIVPMSTNVLFDLILKRLFETFGAEPAQRIAVSLSVLIFFWGAFAFVSAVSGARRWFFAPCLLMLTYGWAFHMGFSNYYLAAGLSLWALALSTKPGLGFQLAAAALLVLAYTAHAMTPAWAVCVIAYVRIAQRLSFRSRQFLLAFAAVSVLVLKFWIEHRYHSQRTFHQVLESSGVDQFWIFGLKYMAISIGVGMLWGFMLLRISHLKGMLGMLGESYFQLCAVTALGILVLPSSIDLPQHRLGLSYITERMSLLHGVMICACLARSDPPRWMRVAFLPLALIYFSFIYVDTNAINRVEQKMETLTSSLTLQDRVFSAFDDPTSRVQLWGHNLDRACLGRCISYSNYEPATLLFRVRAVAPNPLVADDLLDVGAMQDGGYHVKARDLPVYQVTFCGAEMCLRKLEVNEVTKHDKLLVIPLLY